METRYRQNRFYITPEEQLRLKQTHILLGGVGLGSVIAECALRLGFEAMTLIDSEKVTLSDIGQQNFTTSDIGEYKVNALKQRLEEINPSAHITVINTPVSDNDIRLLVEDHNIAINAFDFKTDIPFVFDQICKTHNIPVIHPYNIGWAGLVTIIDPKGKQLSQLDDDWHCFDKKFIRHIANYYRYWGAPQIWLENFLEQSEPEEEIPMPQLPVASWIIAGLATNLLFDLAIGKNPKRYPQFYFSTTQNQ